MKQFTISDNKSLNPKLFSGKMLKNDVRSALLNIVDEFVDYTELPINVVDVQLVGSNAAYNYTDKSDIDLHIISNFQHVDASLEVLHTLYNLQKSNFKESFDITVKGIEVEMYVQDIQDSAISNGIYSVLNNCWIKMPVKNEKVVQYDCSDEISKWEQKINDVISTHDSKTIENTIDQIYLIRHNSLATDGEYGKGNILFKEIRNSGLLDQLKDANKQAKSKMLSLESLNKSQRIFFDI